ncbi:hypothetical protein ACUOCP_32650, partial [Escherichia sp. R-CC3]
VADSAGLNSRKITSCRSSATCDATVAFSREVISCSETMMDEHITTEENQGSNLSGPFLPGQSRTFSYRLA